MLLRVYPRQCTVRPVNCSPLPSTSSNPPTITTSSTNKLLALASMSHTLPTTTSSSSSNSQLIINDALKTYRKRTKNDLRDHPLAAQLQTCDSPSAILSVLQQQVQGLDQSRSDDERWTKWLDPTVQVLYTFSNILGAGVGLVSLTTCSFLRSALIFMSQLFSPASVIFAGVGILLSVCILYMFASAVVTHTSLRRLKMFEQA
jgi:hypothetical protein